MERHEEPSRRDVLKAAALGGAVLGLAATRVEADPAPQAAGTVGGMVFEDAAAGAKRGIPGVLVSNGRDVAVTDADGRYSLPVSDETVVFVVKPPGYMTTLEAGTMLPTGHYIHQPAGTPPALDLTYPGLAPTGPLPASVDFRLTRQEEPKRFDVLLFTDPQPETEAELDFVRDDLMSVIQSTPAAFGMTTGDMMFDDLSLYPRYNRLIGSIGLPWYNVGGNHDLNFEAPDRRHSRETYKRVFGPPTYAFCYADAVFLMLDDVDYLGPDRSKPNNSGKYQGRLDDGQLAFVRNILAHLPEDRLVVIGTHIPFRTYLDEADPAQNLTNLKDLLAILSGRPNTFSISGHTHTTEHHYFGAADGWSGPGEHHHQVLTAVSGSWWSGPYDHRGVAVADSRDGTPNGFHVLSVDGTRCTTRFVPAKEPAERQIRATLHSQAHDEMRRDFRPGEQIQPRIAADRASSSFLVANVFDGGPKTRVTATVGDRVVEMTRHAMPDPFVAELYARNEAVKKAWVKAEPSSHIWIARLPPGLGPGAHPIRVSAGLDDGRQVAARLALEIEG